MIEDEDEWDHYCPDCKGEVACEGEGYRCVHHCGIFIGCGWFASYSSGIEPLAREEIEQSGSNPPNLTVQ